MSSASRERSCRRSGPSSRRRGGPGRPVGCSRRLARPRRGGAWRHVGDRVPLGRVGVAPGWLVVTVALSAESPSGDVALSGGGRQLTYLLGGVVLASAAASLPLPGDPAIADRREPSGGGFVPLGLASYHGRARTGTGLPASEDRRGRGMRDIGRWHVAQARPDRGAAVVGVSWSATSPLS